MMLTIVLLKGAKGVTAIQCEKQEEEEEAN
jgi:hypothetical protein